MGLFDKLRERFAPSGHGGPPAYRGTPAPEYGQPGTGRQSRDPDEVAVERYRYMLRTAPPEAIEQAHAEAFAKLTPEQRRKVLAEVSADLPPAERATSDDPHVMARMATRAEMQRPGTMERVLGGGRAGWAWAACSPGRCWRASRARLSARRSRTPCST
jgi:hypothetical protein